MRRKPVRQKDGPVLTVGGAGREKDKTDLSVGARDLNVPPPCQSLPSRFLQLLDILLWLVLTPALTILVGVSTEEGE